VSSLSKYLTSSGRLPEDALLGYLALTTGADGAHDREALVEEFQKAGLDAKRIPQPSRSIDAFKKATRAHDKAQWPLGQGVTAVARLEEAKARNPEVEVRIIMRHKRDDVRGALTDWERLGELRFFRAVRVGDKVDESSARLQLVVEPDLEAAERERVIQMAGRIKMEWERFRTTLDGVKIRTLLLDYLKSLQAIQLKPSVNFVPVAHAPQLHALSEAIRVLNGCRVDLIPLVDLADQRERLLEAFTSEHSEDMSDLVAKMQEARKKNVSPLVYSQLRARYDELTSRAARYADLLDDQTITVSAATDVAKASLTALAGNLLKGDTAA